MASDEMVVDVSRDWATACGVQQRFMQGSNRAIDNLEYSARCRQVLELGGDCYEFLALPQNRLAVTVGDASGKGLAAALMISNVQSSIRTALLLTGAEGALMLRAVNRQVYASSLADRYATLFYGVFDATAHTLRYVNAGHNPPMVMRPDGSTVWLETGGAPVGIFPDWSYQEGSIQLHPHDLVIAYSDGVIEATNPGGTEWGVEGLRRAVGGSASQSADGIVHAIFTAMDEFSQGCQGDDATVVALRVL